MRRYLRELRCRCGWSQEDVARKCDVNSRTVSKMELGQLPISEWLMARLSVIYGVPLPALERKERGYLASRKREAA